MMIGITCKNDVSKQRKRDNVKLISILTLLSQDNTNIPVYTGPACKYTSSGGTQTNVPLLTATTINQSLKYVEEDLGFGTSLQSYSMVQVTTKFNGNLIFSGSNGGGMFSIVVYANIDPCVINAKSNLQLTSVYTVSSKPSTLTLTFNKANTFLILSSVAFNSEPPVIAVSYSD
jgi:hypothetical protein